MGDNLPGLEEQLTEAQKQALVESLCNHNKRTHEAVIYTHGHFDHVGMLEYVPASMDQYEPRHPGHTLAERRGVSKGTGARRLQYR